MRALSIRQPWAHLILHCGKDIENRDWPTNYRGPVLIHAGKAMTRADYDACALFCSGIEGVELPPFGSLQRGGIVGRATIVGCTIESDSPWFCGTYGFELVDAQPLPFFPCKGALGFFHVPGYKETP